MSRFADPRAQRTVDLGPCECPGMPHERDEVTVRSELSGSEIGALAQTSTGDEAAVATALAPLILGWNLLGPNGEPWPPSADALRALKAPTLTAIVAGIETSIEESVRLPNGSGAPSAASSRGSASRPRTRRLTPGMS